MAFKLGGDTEVFIKSQDGQLKSVIGLLGGSKEDPRKTPNGYVQEDNVLAEFNINPASSVEEFVTNTKLIINDLSDILVPLDLSLSIQSSGIFPETELQHPLAQAAGCDPDYDAWELVQNIPPILEDTPIRSGGGHLHISFDFVNEDKWNRIKMVRILDCLAGVPSVFMDEDLHRRTLYGKAGCHRPKFEERGDQYDGVEYRTLSNFWIKSEKHMEWAFNTVYRAVNDFKDLSKRIDHFENDIKSAINGSNKDSAEKLIKEFDLEVVYA